TWLVDISGAQRELTEGLSSLLAAAVLLGVGLWMHQKSFAGRWKHYIDARLSKIANGRSVWLLTALVFITVYREVFETILFYAALTNDGNGPAILMGLAAGTLVLGLLAFVLLRFSVRLPLARFFSVSSIFIAVLAVVLAGKGAAALQEAGVLTVRTLPFPGIALLGISPSVQTLLLQLCVASAAVAGFVYNRRSAKIARGHDGEPIG
ncbi:MAG TPA: FTR1 family protein, partial [Povalibacter sp.]|nr:FTR1 family protein [Povalibacter sp.]